MEKRGQLLDAVAQELIVCIRFTHEILARIEHDTYIHMYAKYIFESRRSKLQYASQETNKYLIDLKKYPVLSGTKEWLIVTKVNHKRWDNYKRLKNYYKRLIKYNRVINI